MAVNKIIYGDQTLIDLTGDTVSESTLLKGATAHSKDGTVITGACEFDVNSKDATAAVAEILTGKTAYARGFKVTGTMPNNGSYSKTISTKDQEISIPQGYHDGSGKIAIDETEKSKLISANIKLGVSVLGVVGTLEPSSAIKVHAKTITPSKTQQTIVPDNGYDYLSQVIVKAIPYEEAENSAGGTTVTIAG